MAAGTRAPGVGRAGRTRAPARRFWNGSANGRPRRPPIGRPSARRFRALGRLREEAGFAYLVSLLDNPMWARYAADALGDFGDPRAVPALLAAYPRYAKQLDGTDPADVPADDKMGFPSEDRMLETPYWIAYALAGCRWTTRRPAGPARPGPADHGQPAGRPRYVHPVPTRSRPPADAVLMERSGLRQEACEHAFALLGQPRRAEPPADAQGWSPFPPHRIASWLPAVCTEPEDLPRLVALLGHRDGWVRLNAAKALAWLGDRRAIEPLALQLLAAKAEADFGYSGTFKDEEYNDPAPRWREGLLRALGLLGAHEHTDLIVRVLNDQRSVLEVRRAAAEALADSATSRPWPRCKQAADDARLLQHPPRRPRCAAPRGIGVGESASANDSSPMEEPLAEKDSAPSGNQLAQRLAGPRPPATRSRPSSSSRATTTSRTRRRRSNRPTAGGRPTWSPTKGPPIAPATTSTCCGRRGPTARSRR